MQGEVREYEFDLGEACVLYVTCVSNALFPHHSRRYEKMRSTKVELAAELTSLTLNAEKRKEEKLNSIMEKLKADGVVFPGAALANLAEE